MERIDANPPIHFGRLFIRRWLMSIALIFSAYNPSGTSYYHWVTSAPTLTPLQVFAGVLVLALAIAFLRMAFTSLGYFGTSVTVLMVGMGIVLCVGLGLVDFDAINISLYGIEIWASVVLAVGMTWSFVQKRVSGERDVLRLPP